MLLQITIEYDIDESSLTENEIDLILEDVILSLPKSFRIDEDDFIFANGCAIIKYEKVEMHR